MIARSIPAFVATFADADRARFDYWGATGNAAHHRFAWADEIPPKALQHGRGKAK